MTGPAHTNTTTAAAEVPTTKDVRTGYALSKLNGQGFIDAADVLDGASVAFDRWLAAHDAQVRREAKAEALREARVSIRTVLDDTPLLRGLVGINGGAQAMRDFYDESLTELADRIESEEGRS